MNDLHMNEWMEERKNERTNDLHMNECMEEGTNE